MRKNFQKLKYYSKNLKINRRIKIEKSGASRTKRKRSGKVRKDETMQRFSNGESN